MDEEKLARLTKEELFAFLKKNEKTVVDRFKKKPKFPNPDFNYVRAKALVFREEWLSDTALYDKLIRWINEYCWS
jgi:hypothetical protein